MANSMMIGEYALNLSWVTSQLAVGGSFAAELVPHLAHELGLRAVVDRRDEACDDEALLSVHGLKRLHLPTADHCAVSASMLDEGVSWVTAQLEASRRVYIHCEHGIGRSVLLAMCVLVHLGETPRDALLRIRRARSMASPSPAQLEAFMTFCHEYERTTRPMWHELERIAYGPLGQRDS